MAITATITRQDGSTETETFENERQARAFCREECKWESTARVVCPAIGFDQMGDYAGVYESKPADTRPGGFAFIVAENKIIARIKTGLKSGSEVRYSDQRAAEVIRAGRAWNLVNARWGRVSDAAKWRKQWDSMPGEAQAGASEINPGDFYIS